MLRDRNTVHDWAVHSTLLASKTSLVEAKQPKCKSQRRTQIIREHNSPLPHLRLEGGMTNAGVVVAVLKHLRLAVGVGEADEADPEALGGPDAGVARHRGARVGVQPHHDEPVAAAGRADKGIKAASAYCMCCCQPIIH